MDGPNVNWKFFGDLKTKIHDDFGSLLINIGSCGLHIMYNAFKRGMDGTRWKVDSYLLGLYRLFKDAPARKENFLKVTNSNVTPLKFVNHRWLENVPAAQRAIDMWDSVLLYVKAAEEGTVNKPKNCKSYETVKECLDKPLLLSVKQARQNYERYLENERLKKKTAESQAKRKCVLDEIDEIKKKKRRTEDDIKSLIETADKLLLKTEKQGKLAFLTQANSLHKTAKIKVADLEEIDKSLDSKIKELKE
ncbi:hypothetical protein AC249_AIPGENE16597 [Exaiptasia diaphana]|nr:hypothetical protein AC249_AIPGENE16597 [Exaiptasia diaphana]